MRDYALTVGDTSLILAQRLGEWIGEPVTPLFESWLLSELEVGVHAFIRR